MTRNELLTYIANKHGDALAQVGMLPVDSPESLSYVLDDALRQTDDEQRKADADRRTKQLIYDRAQMLGIEEPAAAAPMPLDTDEE